VVVTVAYETVVKVRVWTDEIGELEVVVVVVVVALYVSKYVPKRPATLVLLVTRNPPLLKLMK
jgi:hypothetical protein